jgi:hypothetical protein
MEATYSSEKSTDFEHNTCSYIPEDRRLHKYLCKTLKSYFMI